MKTPEIGKAGGQEFSIVRSIRTFLEQMAEGSARPAPTVLKEYYRMQTMPEQLKLRSP